MSLPSEHRLTVTQRTLVPVFACTTPSCDVNPGDMGEAIGHAATAGHVVDMTETKRTRIEAAPSVKAAR
jgi:hypothetical protein